MKSPKTWLIFFIIFVILSIPLTKFGGIVSGAMEKWRPVTIDFIGPLHSETDSTPNPFLDYRLKVAFTHESSGTTY